MSEKGSRIPKIESRDQLTAPNRLNFKTSVMVGSLRFTILPDRFFNVTSPFNMFINRNYDFRNKKVDLSETIVSEKRSETPKIVKLICSINQ